jgi:hypothetical protein
MKVFILKFIIPENTIRFSIIFLLQKELKTWSIKKMVGRNHQVDRNHLVGRNHQVDRNHHR